MNEEELFHQALARSGPEERAAYLDQACAGNPALRASVEALLRANVGASGFMDQPAPAPEVTLDQPPTERPGSVIGPYKLLEQIGEGGMGTVWMAEQLEPVRRKVALKLIKPGMDSRQVIARFEAERQALALMDHPNIAKVLDAGTTPPTPPSKGGDQTPSPPYEGGVGGVNVGRPYFVMELVKGVPITKYCDDHRLTPRQRLELFVPVCHAIQHAHQKGIIHRDLKPTNVLVALYDDRPVPKVIDFGVAKAIGTPLTEETLHTGFGAVVGTLEYMSPEQAGFNQLDIDTRSDIYSLGVLLYELLAGSPPFSRKELEKAGMLEMLRVIREQEPSKPSTKLSTADGLPTLAANRGTEPAKLTKLVRGELDWIVMKCLEKDRNRRYETANGFAMDVQRYLADEPVLACPPSAIYRLKKFVRRNKAPIVAASLVLLTLMAGIIGTTWGMVEARRRAEGERLAKERAETNFDLANEAVEKYLGTVTNDRKLKEADFHQLRKKLLESAIPFFRKLTAQKSDDPEVEARRGRAYGRLGNVRESMGENEAALQDFEAERAIFARLTADFPNVPAYRRSLAMSLASTGYNLRHLGKRREAEAVYRQALGIREKLAADFPGEPEYRDDLANLYTNLGVLLDDLGRHDETESLYRKAIVIHEELKTDFPTKRAYREGLAATLSSLGVLLSDLGKNEGAEAAYRQALDIREKLVKDFPAEPEYRQDLGNTHNNLGLLLADLEKREEAEAFLRQAVATKEKLRTDFPSVPEYREELATVHVSLAHVLDDLHKHEEAVTALREAVSILRKLADEFPSVPAYSRSLAAAHNNLGIQLNDLGKRRDAEAAYRQSLKIMEKLVADFPCVPLHAVDLAGGYCNFGLWVRDGGQPETALDWYQKGIATLEPVVAKEPRLVDAREFLRNAHKARAEALDDLGRHAQATRDWERALELDDGSNKAILRLRMFRSKQDSAGCLAVAAEYEALKRTDVVGLYDAACNRAICAAVIRADPKTPEAGAPRLAKGQADLAMAWLHQAVAAGYKDVEHMKKDKDLDALREREDFKKLLAELEAKKK